MGNQRSDKGNKLFWFGFNGFGNFGRDDEKRKIKFSAKLTELNHKLPTNNVKDLSSIIISWKITGFAYKNELFLSGFIDKKPHQIKKIYTEDDILEVCNNDAVILVLLRNGKLFQLNFRNLDILEEIKLPINLPIKRTNLGEVCADPTAIIHVACGYSNIDLNPEMIIFLTKSNVLYNFPKKVYQFAEDVEVTKMVCGFLHCLLLTKSGDVYSFGDGLRGQLGHFELECTESPGLIEGLSGVKMVGIAAGGWHSAAISAIGDLYVWGNNSSGQLGLRFYSSDNSINRKNPTIYPIPQLIEFANCCESEYCDIIKVECGSRHTLVLKQCGKIFSTGWNLYGQLGLDKFSKYTNTLKKLFKDEFTEIKMPNCKIVDIYCNQWSSIAAQQN